MGQKKVLLSINHKAHEVPTQLIYRNVENRKSMLSPLLHKKINGSCQQKEIFSSNTYSST